MLHEVAQRRRKILRPERQLLTQVERSRVMVYAEREKLLHTGRWRSAERRMQVPRL
jgi:hypothetical protein